MKTNELYLKTLFCCCACDGEIVQEEVGMIKELTENSTLFQDIQVECLINEYVNQINNQGKVFLKDYLSELSNAVLSDDEQITLIDLAIKMIEADKQVLYSEVKFLMKISGINTLTVSSGTYLRRHLKKLIPFLRLPKEYVNNRFTSNRKYNCQQKIRPFITIVLYITR